MDQNNPFEKFYKEEVVPRLMKELEYKNPMQVPKLSKIVLNSSVSEALQNAKVLDSVVAELSSIAGQKAVVTKARKSIASFKLRQGQKLGAKVTLRRKKMYEFLNRLINIALPRVRDFKGVSAKSFDHRGNYTMGLTEQIIFSEVDYNKIDKIRGMNITLCTTAKNDNEAFFLLKFLGMPFKQNQN